MLVSMPPLESALTLAFYVCSRRGCAVGLSTMKDGPELAERRETPERSPHTKLTGRRLFFAFLLR